MGKHDPGLRRRAQRRGRERGCWVYISQEQLRTIGFHSGEPAPYYRTWEDRGGRPRLVVNLYREP